MTESKWKDYVDSIRVIDADQYLGRARAGSVLLQFSSDDKFISAAAARQYGKAVNQPRVKSYFASHEMIDPRALVDRADFLREQIGVGNIRPVLKSELAIP